MLNWKTITVSVWHGPVAQFDLIVRPAAQQDLRAIYDWISDRASEATALRFIRKIQSSCNSLSDFPYRGTLRDDLVIGARVFGIDRRVTIVFRVEDESVVILRILYAGRDLSSAFNDSNL